MKKLLVLSALLLAVTLTNAQDFKGAASGSLGLINFKIRLQYEQPLNEHFSYGLNTNLRFMTFKGVQFEPFFRLYNKKMGNTEGFFLQGKASLGFFKHNNDVSYYGSLEKPGFTAGGGGIGLGYKILFGGSKNKGEGFIIEPYLGIKLAFTNAFNENNVDITIDTGDDEYYYEDIDAEAIRWVATVGFPLEINVKFGYQF